MTIKTSAPRDWFESLAFEPSTPPPQAVPAPNDAHDAARYRHIRNCSMSERNKLEHHASFSLDEAIDKALAAITHNHFADAALDWAAIEVDFKWDIFERDMLDDEHQKNFKEPWLCVAPDGEVREFKTEDEACTFIAGLEAAK